MKRVQISELYPTQMAVGMREVRHKQDELARLNDIELEAFLQALTIPVVIGPGGRLFMVDRHHYCRALAESGYEDGYAEILADLSNLSSMAFWEEMEARNWVYPVDETGARRPYNFLPSHILGLKNDPYRSLAGFVRDAGGYQKTKAPFSEFHWAHFFRKHLPGITEEQSFAEVLNEARALALSAAAKSLPGYIGTAA